MSLFLSRDFYRVHDLYISHIIVHYINMSQKYSDTRKGCGSIVNQTHHHHQTWPPIVVMLILSNRSLWSSRSSLTGIWRSWHEQGRWGRRTWVCVCVCVCVHECVGVRVHVCVKYVRKLGGEDFFLFWCTTRYKLGSFARASALVYLTLCRGKCRPYCVGS
jgi:hypothetical protein